MPDNQYDVHYAFILPNGQREDFVLTIDEDTMLCNTIADEALPEWTELDFHQCPHCPLKSEEVPHCPLARRLRSLVSRFDAVVSFETVTVEVRTEERLVRQSTSAQRALGAFMGLLMSTSGCPHMAFFKPMARFHLSLANNLETVYRATSMYLLAQYFQQQKGNPADLHLDGLAKAYENIHIVNQNVAERLRHAVEADAIVNGLVLLDSFTMLLPLSIKKSLAHIEHLFQDFPLPGETVSSRTDPR